MGKIEPIITIDHHYSKSDLLFLLNIGITKFRINPARIGIERGFYLYQQLLSMNPKSDIFIDTVGNKARIGLNQKAITVKEKVIAISYKESEQAELTVPFFFFSLVQVGDSIKIKGINDFELRVLSIESNKFIAECSRVNILIKHRAHIYISNRYEKNYALNSVDLCIIKRFDDNCIFALSFVDGDKIVRDYKNISKNIVYAKIESKEGIKNIKEIALEANGIIVGRDDLSIFYSKDEIQNMTIECIRKCKKINKECIPASNLFLSLIDSNEISKKEIEFLRLLVDEGVEKIYCNETVIGNKNIAKKILNICRRM